MARDFAKIFDACVALDGGAELLRDIAGQRIAAHAEDGRCVLVIDGLITMQGSAFDVACGFLDACAKWRAVDASRRAAAATPPTSHTRLRALADTPTLPSVGVVIKNSTG